MLPVRVVRRGPPRAIPLHPPGAIIGAKGPAQSPKSSTKKPEPLPDWAQATLDVEEELVSVRAPCSLPAPELLEAPPRPTPGIQHQVRMQHFLAAQVAATLEIHFDAAFALLRSSGWLVDPVCEACTSENHEIWNRAGVPQQMAKRPLSLSPAGEGACGVCFEATAELLALPCGHSACENCWRDYLLNAVSSGVSAVTCVGCQLPVSIWEIRHLCGDSVFERYEATLVNSDLLTSHARIPCIRLDCPHILTIESIGVDGIAQCACGMRICWRCREPEHTPLPCAKCTKWRCTLQKDFASWFKKRKGQMCPNCRSLVEKTTGCNHMACKCGCDFCYHCGRSAPAHRKCFPCGGKPAVGFMGGSEKQKEWRKVAAAVWQAEMEKLEAERADESRLQGNLARKFGDGALSAVDAVLHGRSLIAWAAVYACVFRAGPDAKILTWIYGELRELLDRVSAVARGEQQMGKREFALYRTAIDADIEMIKRFAGEREAPKPMKKQR